MAVRPSLNHKPAPRPAPAAASEPPPAAPSPPAIEAAPEDHRRPRSTVSGYRPPSRVGKRAAVAWLEPEAIKQLNMEAIRRDRNVQDLLVEAVNDWFAKNGLPRFDEES
jgi:hypothetical protein